MGRTNMIIENRKLSPYRFVKYINDFKFKRKVKKLVFHHTSSSLKIWEGSASMLHYYNLYNSRGWKDGPHIFIARDGIWLFSNLNRKGMTADKEAQKKAIQIEIVGRYYDNPPDDPTICRNVGLVADVLTKKLKLNPYLDIFHHHGFDPHSNCSPHVHREWVTQQINKFKNLNKEIYEDTNFQS